MAGATQLCLGVSYRAREPTHRLATEASPGLGASLTADASWGVPTRHPAAAYRWSLGALVNNSAPTTAFSPNSLRICPFGLRSQATVHMHINRMLLRMCSSTSRCSSEGGSLLSGAEIENLSSCLTGGRRASSPPSLVRDYSPPEPAASRSPPTTTNRALPDLDNDIHERHPARLSSTAECDSELASGDEGEEEGDVDQEDDCEYGYESDSEDEFVEFSDEFVESDSDSGLPSSTAVPPRPANCYMALCSVESGYGDGDGEESFSNQEEEGEEEWSDGDCSESTVSKVDSETETGRELWEQFQRQALTPMLACGRQRAPSPLPGHDLRNSSFTHTAHRQPTSTCSSVEPSSPAVSPTTPLHTQCTNSAVTQSDSHDNSHCLIKPSCGKHVSFKPDAELTEVHRIIAWDYAYRSARRGPWEEYARDRMYFRRRIETVAPILESCLSKKLQSLGLT